MTPKLAGIASAFQLLKHNLENDADALARRIAAADARRQSVVSGSHGALNAVDNNMKDIEDFLGALEGVNGAPGNESSASSAPRSSEVAQK